MKLKTTLLPLFTTAFGAVGLFFRFWVQTAGTDAEGLVIQGHPSVTVMLLLFAAMAVILAAAAIFMDKAPSAPGKSTVGAIGCYIGAVGLLITAIIDIGSLEQTGKISDIAGILNIVFGFASVVVMVLMGSCRSKGKALNIWAYTVIVVFFVFHLLYQYQLWTQQPQLSEYLFPLLGSVFLMLATYNRACKEFGQPAQVQHLIFSQSALFCAILAISSQSPVFYISMAAWTLLDNLPGKEEA